ncbi:MAG: hypothetical protein HY246_18030 [Proteobacteria bacterium]|nr:hypothetical protein [Pseudomonadota bacterium]
MSSTSFSIATFSSDFISVTNGLDAFESGPRSIVSFVINIGVLLMLILIFFFWKNSAPHVWIAIWAVLSIGLPLSAMLFVTIKARDNLKNIEAALSKGAPNKKP